VTVGLFAFALLASVSPSAAAGSSERTSVAASALGDRAATDRLLKADEALAKAVLARARATDAAAGRAEEAFGHECKGVLRGAPDESALEEEGPFASQPKLSGRAQGERARSEREKQTIDLEIEETVWIAGDRVLRRPYEAYIATVGRLTWSDPTIDALVQQRAARLHEDLAGPPVAICAELRAWAASGFHVLPSGVKRLQEAREARGKQAVQGDLAALLAPYEDSAARASVRRISALKERLREQERDDEASLRAEYRMELALGEKVSRSAEQRFAPVIAKGRTSAGTTFVIRRAVGKSFSRSCRHEVDIEVREGSGDTDGGLCLGDRARSRPSGSCSESVATVELATPPDVRRVRVRLSDGRAVTVAVVRVPAKDGGPAGVFVDAFRGYRPYPVSAQELNRDGKVLRTIPLSRVRCTKEPAGEPTGPQFVDLAIVTTPSGESLTIQGTLIRVDGQTEFSLGPQPGLRNREAGEEHRDSKQFQWDLSTECAPHPYSLIAGVLVAPAASVAVRTPSGLTPLTKVELATSTHAPGPLLYGVYATPPTEIAVERSDGSVLYTESLAAKATEETEFCEGYAER
jgi:hypothetical protein